MSEAQLVKNIKYKEPPFLPVLIFSIAFHILIFFIVPIMTRIMWRPKTFTRPKTFQLVTVPVQKIQKKIIEKPKPKKKKKIVEKKKGSKPVEKKPEPEDLSELEDLLGGLPQLVSQINIGPNFPYQWYINNIQAKVERNWKPPVDNKELTVVLLFTIFRNGKISDVKIKKSSGNSMLDNLALRAIKLSAPFGRFPPAYPEKSLNLTYTLIPSIK